MTLLPHQSQQPCIPLVPPLVQSTTFEQTEIGADAPHRYSRESNPTVDALEKALGDLERAEPALCFATGLAAETALFETVTHQGGHVVFPRQVYGGTTRLLEQVLSRFGVASCAVDTRDLGAVERVLEANRTQIVFAETPANPTLEVSDLRALSRLAHRHGALLAVDNTFLTPTLQQPLDLGADVSVYSTTKFVEGHSTALGGALVTRDKALRDRLFLTRKCTGAIQSPFGAWLTLNGLRTLNLRLERQSATAAALAAWLEEHPETTKVLHPSLPNHPDRQVASTQHLGAHGAVVSFELQGGYERAVAFLAELRSIKLVEHVGSVETLITHSASMTHGGLTPEQREAAGLSESLLRLSVGVEPAPQLREELSRAITASRLRRSEGVRA
ncbi:MAG: aminotransferase class I/II-fold pyridoxal phosphate-dependent enzyme [Planctomycetota bacterium]